MELPSQRPTPIEPKRQQKIDHRRPFAVDSVQHAKSGCRFKQQKKQLGEESAEGICISKEVKTVSRKKN
jgi:hypothetical protein